MTTYQADQVCPFGRMASALVSLVPTPFCRRDTLDSIPSEKVFDNR